MPFWSSSATTSSKWAAELDDAAMFKTKKTSQRQDSASSGFFKGAGTLSPRTAMLSSLPLPATDSPSPSMSRGIRRYKVVRFVQSFVTTVKANLTAVTPPSSTSHDDVLGDLPFDAVDVPDAVSESHGVTEKIVVEQSWGSGSRPLNSESSEHNLSPEKKTGSSPPTQVHVRDRDEEVVHSNFYLFMRYWPVVREFFYPRPFDIGSEQRYNQDDWASRKNLAILASTWLIINWILGCIFVPRPWTAIDYAFYAAIAPVFSLPVIVMVMYDWPRDRQLLYQCFLVFSTWMWSFVLLINMYICGFYNPAHRIISCNGKDFIGTFYYTTALQTIALFGLRLDRLPGAIAALSFFVISMVLITPDHPVWTRSMINFFVFQAFLLWLHYKREGSERRHYSLRNQLKMQYKALQRAQANERRTSESKHRLTSYVFHVLAAQSMAASGTVSKTVEVEFDALMGSLTMMSQVLNDVLDFNRLDSGQFELVAKPYAFHQAMRSLFIPLKLATEQKGLTLHTDLDPNIDRVARCAAYTALGGREDVITQHLKEHPDVDGVVIGDEARFRQIVTNLASNACKFTPTGGSVTVRTCLMMPAIDTDGGKPDCSEERSHSEEQLSASRLAQHNINHAKEENASIVVRIEVIDTGCGIEHSELVGGKLFSAFTQTEKGRQQGAKGTGLGLALVRNIVKLSGGRLGVKSKVGAGSTFWVELPLGVGRQTLLPSPGLRVVDSEGSMSSDVAKVRAAASQGEAVQGTTLTSNNSLTAVVDAAALKASEMSSVNKSSALMHSTIMDQAGRVDLVVESRGSTVPLASIRTSPSVLTPLPTPATDLSVPSTFSLRLPDQAKNERLPGSPTSPTESPNSKPCEHCDCPRNTNTNIHSSDSRTEHSDEIGGRTTNDVFSDTSTPTPTQPISIPKSPRRPGARPTHIPIPERPFFRSDSSGSSTTLALFDSSFSRTNTTSFNSSPEFQPGLPVLVVDDDTITRRLMDRMLTRLGCVVTVAENGKVALKVILGDEWDESLIEPPPPLPGAVRSSGDSRMRISFERGGRGVHDANGGGGGGGDEKLLEKVHEKRWITSAAHESKFAVIFLDNQMPVLSGLRTVQVLRQLKKKDFVVGLTGNALLPDQDEYLRAGVDIVLTKPVLELKIKDVLKQADARRQSARKVSKSGS